jgi:hypothetical protein
MTITTRRLIIEVMRSHLYLKIGSWECFKELA